MEALISIVAPVFGIILTGYFAGRFDLLGSDAAAALNRFVFLFAVPCALFVFMARAPFDRIFNWPFIGAFTTASALTVLIAVAVGRLWFRHDAATLSIVGLTTAFGNVVYMGLPLLLTAYGPSGALPTTIATLCIIIFFASSAIGVLEASRVSSVATAYLAVRVGATILRNPLVIAPLLGVIFSMGAIELPMAISRYLDLLAAAVGPVALFALGLSLAARKWRGNTGEALWIATLKGVVNPILAFALVTYVFALDGIWAHSAIILAAMPVGANPYVIAQQYGVHVGLVSPAIVISTALSVVTIAALLSILGTA